MDRVAAFHQVREQRISQGNAQVETSLLASLSPDFSYQATPSPLGLIFRLELSSKLLPELSLPHDTVAFVLQLPPLFPVHKPKLYGLTDFCSPSVADGRDLMREVLQRDWDSQVSIHTVFTSLPAFLVAVT